MKNRTGLVLLLSALLGLPSCVGKNGERHSVPSTASSSQKEQQGEVFVGLASYYGYETAGKAASGMTYDPEKLTAAHRTLPLGTRVRVTNLENNRFVVVVITDRGPSKPDRIVDLSLAAARELSMLGAGVVKVRVEVIYE